MTTDQLHALIDLAGKLTQAVETAGGCGYPYRGQFADDRIKDELDVYSAVADLARELLASRERVAKLEAAARPFAVCHLYADAELSHLPIAERDAIEISHYVPDSPTYGHSRTLAALVPEEPCPNA